MILFFEKITTFVSSNSNCDIMSIEEIQQEIISEFSAFDDWMDKYTYLIELGNELIPLDEKYKVEQNLIKGCQSQVWLNAEYKDGFIYYQGESDALIVKGLVALLLRVVNGQPAVEIMDTDFHFIDKIGLKEHLSPTRSNGLLAMAKQIKLYAVAFNKMNS
jgi:cysteine desulfuration protein SufE